MYEYAIDSGLTVGALTFDGFLLKNNPLINDKLLRGMEEYVSWLRDQICNQAVRAIACSLESFLDLIAW